MQLSNILKDSNYKLSQFSAEKIKTFEEQIIEREAFIEFAKKEKLSFF